MLLALAAAFGCGKAASQAADGLLKGGDRLGALKLLEEGRAKNPGALPTRYRLFVLYRYLAAQGDPAGHDAYINSAIGEYEAIAKAEGVTPDYRDMEGSLKGREATRAAYDAAYAAVYAR